MAFEKQVLVKCDQPGCPETVRAAGSRASRDTALRVARYSGWEATRYRQLCPQHRPVT
jgi:hypothetical protein